MNDEFKMSGRLKLIWTDPDGTVETEELDNLIVAGGRNHAASRMVNSPPTAMSHIAIGTGSTPPANTDTTLVSEIARKAASSGVTDNNVTYSVTFNPGEGTGEITEAAILNAGVGGTMMSRVVFSARNKLAEKSLTIIWTITFN